MRTTPRGRRVGRAVTAGAAALFICALAVTPAAADPSPSPSASAPATLPHDKSTFVIGLRQDLDSLNPYVGVTASAFDAYQMMYDFLTDVGQKDMSVVPSLAQKWETSADGLTWTFHLHEGVKWSDGQPLTSADVVYSFNRVLAADSTENGQYGSGLTNVTKVSAPDPTTVVITTSKPSATLIDSAIPIVPEHIWKNVSEAKVGTFPNDGSDGAAVVGSGPFVLQEAKKGQFYKFKANPNYWNGAPHISELIMQIYQTDETMTQALEKGDIDFAQNLSASAFNGLKNQHYPNITLNSGASPYVFELGMNNGAQTVDNKPIGDGNPALKNLQVRQAIDYAIDKQSIVDKVLFGAGQAAYGEMTPMFAQYYWEPTGAEKRTYDPAKAKSLLEAAGYKAGPDGMRTGPDGKPFSLRVFGRSDNSESQTEVRYIAEWLKDVGIATKVQIISEDALTDVIGKGDYDLFQWDWVWGPDPDGDISVFSCGERSTMDSSGAISAGWSDSFYCNPAFEALYGQQKSMVDQAQRAVVVKQALQNLYDNAMYSTLYYGKTLEAYRNDRFTGFLSQPASGGPMASQLGTWSYRNITTATAKASSGSNFSVLTIAIAGGVLVLLVGVGAFVGLRRRTTADDRE